MCVCPLIDNCNVANESTIISADIVKTVYHTMINDKIDIRFGTIVAVTLAFYQR